MVTGIGSNSIPQQIAADIKNIDDLIDLLKKKDGITKGKELINLLIEYIIAVTQGDSARAQAILGQIAALPGALANDLKAANQLKDDLKSISNDPKEQTGSELEFLQTLQAALQSMLR